MKRSQPEFRRAALPLSFEPAAAERFCKYVLKDQGPKGCDLWFGGRKPAGYGVFKLQGRSRQAHRAAYAIFRGDVPAGLNVRHTCDNPQCVNPSHLLVGTQADNIHDAMERGRHVPPPRTDWQSRIKPHHWQRLTEDQARQIHQRAAAGETLKAIAKDFGISFKTVSKIKLGQRWPQLAREPS